MVVIEMRISTTQAKPAVPTTTNINGLPPLALLLVGEDIGCVETVSSTATTVLVGLSEEVTVSVDVKYCIRECGRFITLTVEKVK